MKIFSVLLSIAFTTQLCYGAVKSSGHLKLRPRRMVYSPRGLPKFANLASDEKRALYSYEQTIVVKDEGLDGKVRRCEVVEVYEVKKAINVLNFFKSVLALKVEKVDMERMMSLLNECDSTHDLGDEVEGQTKKSSKNLDSPDSLTNGIFPGTKWCGKGDVANSYHDLGKLHDVDRCCRSHDFCPVKVRSKDVRYNLTNDGMYTKSHCLCDEAFYNCLKKDGGFSAKLIGMIYFNAASPQCIVGSPEYAKENIQFIPATNHW